MYLITVNIRSLGFITTLRYVSYDLETYDIFNCYTSVSVFYQFNILTNLLFYLSNIYHDHAHSE